LDLIDISTISAGYPFRGKISEAVGSDVRVIQMKDIDAGYSVRWDAVIKTQLTGRQNPNWLQHGDILFAARGQRNYAAMIDAETNQFNIIAAPQFFIIRLNSANVLPEYLTWFLNQSATQRYFLSNAEGSTTPSIRRTVLEATPLIIPSLAQQKVIIELAKIIKKEKEIAEKIIGNGERLLQCLLTEMSHKHFNKEDIAQC